MKSVVYFFDGMRHLLSWICGFSWLRNLIPMRLKKLVRRLRIHVWRRGAYQELLRDQGRQGRRVLHFLHISKTGGTAIKSSLAGRFNTDRYHVLVTPHPFRLRDVPKGEAFAFILRDPIRRFVSAFNHRLAEGRPAYCDPWTKAERKVFTQFPDANSLGRALASSDRKVSRQAAWAMRHVALLDTPYTFWLGSLSYLRSRDSDLCFIGFQESLTEDFARFQTIAGYPEVVCLPTDAGKANRTGSSSTKLDPEAERALRVWYAEDYALHEYCKSLSGKSSPEKPDVE